MDGGSEAELPQAHTRAMPRVSVTCPQVFSRGITHELSTVVDFLGWDVRVVSSTAGARVGSSFTAGRGGSGGPGLGGPRLTALAAAGFLG